MARTNNLTNFLTDVSQAIKNKKGSQTPIKASDFDTEIANLPTGGGVRANADDDVLFIDYDGEIVISYSKEEFLQLTELPPNPTHEGLISQGWNWTLEDAQDYVSKYDGQVIGQNYVTDDNTLRLYVELLPNTLDIAIYFALGIGDSCEVDFGDGTVTTFGGGTITHVYQKSGNYVIKLKSTGSITISGSSTQNSRLFGKKGNLGSSDKPYYKNLVKKIELSNNVTFSQYGLYGLGIESITIPKNLRISIDYNIYNLTYLKALVTDYFAFGSNDLANCYNLKYFSLSKQFRNFSSYTIKNFTSLKRLYLPEGVTGLNNIGQGGRVPERLTMPKVINIEGSTFNTATYMDEIIFYGDMKTLSSSFGARAEKVIFKETPTVSIPNTLLSRAKEIIFEKSVNRNLTESWGLTSSTYCYLIDLSNNEIVPSATASFITNLGTIANIVVPDELYDEWIVAENWSTIADRIIKKSDWDALKG